MSATVGDDPTTAPAPSTSATTASGSSAPESIAIARGSTSDHVLTRAEPTERVLVVDDSPQNRLVATGHLEAAGYEVIAAESGEEALDILVAQRIDLVVLDVLMPGLGGFETCRRIRANPATADIPILFLTALGDREATGPALESGGDDLLPKPFNRAELLLRSKALIRARRITNELRETLRELAAHNEQLRRAEHDKRKMAAVIVHDLRGPVSGVMANAELIRGTTDLGEIGELVDELMVAATQIDRTARDLLDLARAEEGVLKVHVERFVIGELIGEVVAALRGLARWSEVELVVEAGVGVVAADRELVRRLLTNLVHNAVNHAPKKTTVTISAVIEDGNLILRVVDAGIGVAPADAERIFERFITLRDDVRKGSHGLGLAFCRLAAEAHGGAIWVKPGQATGATFCVRIPQPAVPA